MLSILAYGTKVDIYYQKINFFTKQCDKGLFIDEVTALGGRGYQGFCDDSTKALVIKSVTMGEGVSKIIK
jgi:hypothetical protein